MCQKTVQEMNAEKKELMKDFIATVEKMDRLYVELLKINIDEKK